MLRFCSAMPSTRLFPTARAAALVAILIAGHPLLSFAQSAAVDSVPSVRLDSLLDLPTVVARALAVSPAVRGSREDVRVAHSDQQVANAAFFPTLTVNSSLLNSNIASAPIDGTLPPSAYSAGLAASVDVFTGGRRGADKARTSANLGAAESRDISQRYQVTFVAQSAFFETLRAGDLVDVAKARVTQAAQALRYAVDRVRAGTTTRSDQLRAQLELTSARQQLVAVTDTLQTAAYALGRLVGANGPIGGKRPATLDPTPLALGDSAIVQLAVDASPAVRAAQAQQRADEEAVRSTRTVYVPDLKLTGGYNLANRSTIVSAVHPGWALLLSTSYPLFNGFRRENDVTRAESAAEVARVTTLDLGRATRSDAARLLSGLHYAVQNISLANEAVQASAEDLRVQTERYRAGISTELDQLTSQLAYTQAQVGLVSARYKYQLTRAQLEALVGRSL
jgi:outer membrane protein